MNPPHFTKHGTERQGKTDRHRPRSRLADYQKLPRRHEPTVNSYTQHGQEAAYYSHQHYRIGGGMRRVYNSEKLDIGYIWLSIVDCGVARVNVLTNAARCT